jgi:hypothetical protein
VERPLGRFISGGTIYLSTAPALVYILTVAFPILYELESRRMLVNVIE